MKVSFIAEGDSGLGNRRPKSLHSLVLDPCETVLFELHGRLWDNMLFAPSSSSQSKSSHFFRNWLYPLCIVTRYFSRNQRLISTNVIIFRGVGGGGGAIGFTKHIVIYSAISSTTKVPRTQFREAVQHNHQNQTTMNSVCANALERFSHVPRTETFSLWFALQIFVNWNLILIIFQKIIALLFVCPLQINIFL